MKNTLTIICLTLVVFNNGCAFGQLAKYPWIAKIKVMDEGSNPIAGADVSVSYNILPPPSDPNLPTYGEVRGVTDNDGLITASHTDSSWTFAVTVTKTGYYPTHIGHELYQPGQFDDKTVAASRNPAITLMLKKIGKPIAMYAKQIDSITFPEFNKAIGYDLMAGDWVAPYGKGVNADFLFTENHADAKSGYTFTVSFPHLGDGIQGFTRDWSLGVSGLLSSHEAPINGYESKYEQTQIPNSDRIFYFRVRTVLDHQGNVVSAHYGKIYGDFMQFRYYLNPTLNDRNVEFDPKQNLIQSLQSFERVSAP